MSTREDFIGIFEGRSPSRTLFTPRMDIWFEAGKRTGTLPAEYAGLSLEDIRKDLGVDMSARGGKVFRVLYENVKTYEISSANATRKYYETPLGTVYEEYSLLKEDGRRTRQKKCYMIKGLEEYRVVEYIIENMHYEPTYDDFLKYEEEIGDRAYPLCVAGRIPMNDILLDYIGYNNAYFEMADHLEAVEHLNSILEKKMRELQDILLDSPARLFLHGAHFDTQMTPPSIFNKYFVPYYQAFVSKLNEKNKWVVAHQDADASGLLQSYKLTGVHGLDCFACHPIVKLKFEDAIRFFGRSIVIWGGIPSALLCPSAYTEDEFEEHLYMLKENVGKGNVILAVADNVMPGSDINRIRRIVEFFN